MKTTIKFVLIVCLAYLIRKGGTRRCAGTPRAENILLDGCWGFLGDISLPSFSQDSNFSLDNHLYSLHQESRGIIVSCIYLHFCREMRLVVVWLVFSLRWFIERLITRRVSLTYKTFRDFSHLSPLINGNRTTGNCSFQLSTYDQTQEPPTQGGGWGEGGKIGKPWNQKIRLSSQIQFDT